MVVGLVVVVMKKKKMVVVMKRSGADRAGESEVLVKVMNVRSVEMLTPWWPPAALNLSACWGGGMRAGSVLGGSDVDLLTLQVIRPENCSSCGKRIRFGKVAVKCRNCRMVTHLECQKRVVVSCSMMGAWTQQVPAELLTKALWSLEPPAWLTSADLMVLVLSSDVVGKLCSRFPSQNSKVAGRVCC